MPLYLPDNTNTLLEISKYYAKNKDACHEKIIADFGGKLALALTEQARSLHYSCKSIMSCYWHRATRATLIFRAGQMDYHEH